VKRPLTQLSPGNFAKAKLPLFDSHILKRIWDGRGLSGLNPIHEGKAYSGVPSPLGEKDRMRGTLRMIQSDLI
jgi:hypothetical protein